MDNQAFVNELSKLRPASTFLTLKGYRSESSEIADYSLAFHISYANALKQSIATLEALATVGDLEAQAKRELLESFHKSLLKGEETAVEDIDDAYTRFFDDDGNYIKGVKMHTATGALHLYGLVVHKRVLMPGNYAKVNSKPLTIAKNKMRALTRVGKFQQFKILPSQVDKIAVEGLDLLPPE